MEIRLVLNGLDCANCANKIETKVNKINGVKEATINFSTTLLIAEIKEESLKDEIINEIKSIVKKLEPDVKVEEKLNVKSKEIAVVGDQIFTDIIGGNRCKMFTILVDPVDEKDFWYTAWKRPIENKIKKKIVKGEKNVF